MLSPSCRELSHQQFVSVWEGGDRTIHHYSGKTKYARQHRHSTVWYGADKVDRETLVETAPSLKVYDLPRGVYDARSLAQYA
jgi:hypothetical protein